MNQSINQSINHIQQALFSSWSLQSSSKWSVENPAKGQCGVTALVVNDLLGGEIYKTNCLGGWHFYNMIDGKAYDFTSSQFIAPILYQHILSNREEAFADTNDVQYSYLKEEMKRHLLKTKHS